MGALTKSLGAMAMAKASLSTKSRKLKLGKSKNKIAQKEVAAKQLVNNSSKTAGRKNRGFIEGSATTTSREARSNLRSARRKNVIQKKSDFASEIK